MKYLFSFLIVACAFLAMPGSAAAQQVVRCESNGSRHYCSADTSAGVQLNRQISRSSCIQGSTWGYTARGIWVDRGCRADFQILAASNVQALAIRCESNDGGRHYCPADTGAGVQLRRQISGSPCVQGSTCGYDQQGVWVDQGCRADFTVLAANPYPNNGYPSNGYPSNPGYGQGTTLRCESNDGNRHYCAADTRGGVTLSRQISGSACIQGSTWGYDQRGVWVDQGCRADFTVLSANGGNGYPSNNGYGQPTRVRCESRNNSRQYCPADTSGGVTLSRRISGTCRQGSTWGYDQRGIWVDRGCRADFTALSSNAGYGNPYPGYPNSNDPNSNYPNGGYGQATRLRCESNDGNRHYCSADTRAGVTLSRQISGDACIQGSTWGYDQQGVWVDRGCRAEFTVQSAANNGGNPNYPYSGATTTIPAGTEIDVRSNETIDSQTAAPGQRFTGVIGNDVRDSSGAVAIARGSDVQLVIRSISTSDLILDIDSVVANGQRYAVSTTDLERKGRQGVGANKRTGEMVGGGAALGAIIGAIAGGGKGAAIGASVGAAAGAGGTAVTRGRDVKVPAETMLKFTLDQDLRMQLYR